VDRGLVLAGTPLIGTALSLLPWPVRLIFLPGLVAHVLCRTTDDGRPLHEAVAARVGFIARPRRLVGLERVRHMTSCDLGPFPVAADERMPEYRCGAINGPAALLLRQPGELSASGRTVRLTPTADSPMLHTQELHLQTGQRLVIGS
jgi:hypothetical protein